MTYELQNGLTIGAVEKLSLQHRVRSQGNPAITKLAIELEWATPYYDLHKTEGPYMRAPIVRGAPYTSMIYLDASPRIYSERPLSQEIVIDEGKTGKTLKCGVGVDRFSSQPVTVQRELRLTFDAADTTWLVFVSEPTEFECSGFSFARDLQTVPSPESGPGNTPAHHLKAKEFFELRSTNPMSRGMMRVAMVNNCTVGQNAESKDEINIIIIIKSSRRTITMKRCTSLLTIFVWDDVLIDCDLGKNGLHKPRNQDAYEQLIRVHAEMYPTGAFRSCCG